jgi:amino acid permease
MFQKRDGTPPKFKGFFARHRLAIAVTTLIGTIVGAGVLGIPYVVAKSGFLYGAILIIALGLAFLILNLFVGEIVLRTKEQHQLTGYMEKYLGKWGKRFMAFSMIFGIYGALTAYLIGEGQTLKTILGFGSPLIYSLIFFAIVAFIICKGVKATGKTELIIISLLIVVVFVIGLFSFKEINTFNFTSFNPAFFFLPYGVILFAFMGSAAIPEVQEILEKEKHKMKKAIILGSIIPIILYFMFSAVVVGIVGLGNFELLAPNERIATVALSMYSNSILGLFANIFAVLAMFTSFLTLGIALVEMYNYDFKISRKLSLALTLIIPLIIALSNLTTFIVVLGLAGVIAGGVDGILIVLAYWKVKRLGNRKPEFSLRVPKIIGLIIIFMFALGIIYQIWQNFF